MSDKLPPSLFSLVTHLEAEGKEGHEQYAAIRRYIQFKAREKAVPVCGTFELTPLCNLSCKMCYVRLSPDQLQGRKLLDVDTWKNIFDQAVEAGLMYATLTGGECLTYPGFKELYLYLGSKGIETTVLSNGVLMTDEMVQFLASHPPFGIQITLYGVDDDEYERVTGQRVFKDVMAAFDRLKAADIPFSLCITPNQYMRKGKELVRLLYEIGVPFSINSGLKTPREETGRSLLEAPLELYAALYRENQALGGRAAQAVLDEDLPDPEADGKEELPIKGIRCAAGRSSYCITWDGKMKPCNSFPGISEDILNTTFREAWNRIHQQVSELCYPSECTRCRYQKVCKSCIVEHLDGGCGEHANPRVCEFVKRFIHEGIITR